MPSLADTQLRVRRAVVTGEATDVEPLLVGGRHAAKRLAIHHRHYETSLVTAILGKFPATAWLVGTPFLTQAAQQFVREHPPQAPCIAEYGADFPEFLSTRPTADRVPYLRPFAELEWHLGQVSVAIDRPAAGAEVFSGPSADALTNALLILQPGVRYLHAPWPIDDLIRLHLTDTAPSYLALELEDVWIEVRGARGAFHMKRLDAAEFVFRQALRLGTPLGDAAEQALDAQPTFEPGGALAALFAEGLVTAVSQVSPDDKR